MGKLEQLLEKEVGLQMWDNLTPEQQYTTARFRVYIHEYFVVNFIVMKDILPLMMVVQYKPAFKDSVYTINLSSKKPTTKSKNQHIPSSELMEEILNAYEASGGDRNAIPPYVEKDNTMKTKKKKTKPQVSPQDHYNRYALFLD